MAVIKLRSLVVFLAFFALFSSVSAIGNFTATLNYVNNLPSPQSVSIPLTDQLTQVTATVTFLTQVVDVNVCLTIWPTAPSPDAWEDNCDAFINYPFSVNSSGIFSTTRYGVYSRSGSFRAPVKRATNSAVLAQSVYLRNTVYNVFVSGVNTTVSLNFFIPLCDNSKAFGPTCQTNVIDNQPFGQVQQAVGGYSVIFQIPITTPFSTVTLTTLPSTTFVTPNKRATSPIVYSASFEAIPINGNEDYPQVTTLVLNTPSIGTWYVLVNSTVQINTLVATLNGTTCPSGKIGINCTTQINNLGAGDVETNPATPTTPDFYQFQITTLPANFSVSVVYLNTSLVGHTPQMWTQFNQVPIISGPGSDTNLFSTCNVGACTQTITQQIIGVKSKGTFYVAVFAPLGSYIIWDSNRNQCPNCQSDGKCFAIGACSCSNESLTADCSTPRSGLTTVQIVLISVASVIIAAVVVAVVVFAIFKCRRKPGYQSI